MVRIIEAHPDHLRTFVPSKIHEGEATWLQVLELSMHFKLAWTVFWNNQPVAFIGYSPIWNGVCALWAVVGENIKPHGLSVSRAIRRFIGPEAKKRNAHRLQMYIKLGNKDAYNWAQFFGFHTESILTAYGAQGEDYCMMVRFT